MAEPAPAGEGGVAAALIGDVPLVPPPAGEGVAAAFIGDARLETLKPLLDCLLPKWILRMRNVCTAWRDKLRDDALLTRLNRAEPPQPLLCVESLDISDYTVESLDLRSGKPRSVLRFTDNNDRMEKYGVTVHASLDGYLLVSFFSSRRKWYIINPATRRWVHIFDPVTFGLDVIGLYEHCDRDSRVREYRVLCLERTNPDDNEDVPTYKYTVLQYQPGQRRDITLPISPAAREDHGLRFGVERACISPPIQRKRGNMYLLWPPQQSQRYHMLVFDTTEEVFSWKRPPPPVAMAGDQDMRLLEFPDDNIGLSVSRANEATLELWCLEDYWNEVWVRKHRIELALQQMPALHLAQNRPWIPAVVSAEGDVLIESPHGQFHCGRDGNLLHRFWFDLNRTSHRVLPIRHVLKRSFRSHQMFEASKNAAESPVFLWLDTDAD